MDGVRVGKARQPSKMACSPTIPKATEYTVNAANFVTLRLDKRARLRCSPVYVAQKAAAAATTPSATQGALQELMEADAPSFGALGIDERLTVRFEPLEAVIRFAASVFRTLYERLDRLAGDAAKPRD
jgi:hypothetical protein